MWPKGLFALLVVLFWMYGQHVHAESFQLSAVQDVFIGNDSLNGPTQTDNSSGLHIRDIPTRRRVAFLSFDISTLKKDDHVISQARFNLYGHDVGRVEVYGVIESLDNLDLHGLTWNTAPGVQNLPTPPLDSPVELDHNDLTVLLLSFTAPAREIRDATLTSPTLDAFLNQDTDGTVVFLFAPARAGQTAIIRASEHTSGGTYLEGNIIPSGTKLEDDPNGPFEPTAPMLTDNGSTVTLSNGIVTGIINKSSGRMLALYKGNSPNLIGDSWYWSIHAQGVFEAIGNTDYRVVRNEPNLIEVAFQQYGMAQDNLDFDVHYVLQRGKSGFHAFAVLTRDEGPAWELEQARSVVRNHPDIFYYMIADDNRQVVPPTPWELADIRANGGILSPSEATRLPDGRVDDKYLFSDFMGEHVVHGWAGHGYGLWSIAPNHEYQNGGPTTQELTVHQTETTPVILNTFMAAHYGSGVLTLRENESWQKLFGPFFIYVNQGDNEVEQWADAKDRALIERDEWPYSWMEHPLYPLQRSTVRGTLTITDGTSPNNAWVILSAPENAPLVPHWQQQARGYQFYTRADANGVFEIPHVRTGSYSLYAFVTGVPEELRIDGIEVTAPETIDLGILEWTPERYGRRLWQIGTFDRTAGEYKYGDLFHDGESWGMWLNYPTDFPDDIDFVIGTSRERDDWNYVQMAYDQGNGTYHLPVWNVHFDLDDLYPGQAMLTVGIAASRNGALEIKVNDTLIESDTQVLAGSACVRNSIQGTYQLKRVAFNSAFLRQGDNIISFRQFRGRQFANIMYDAVRLEVPVDDVWSQPR